MPFNLSCLNRDVFESISTPSYILYYDSLLHNLKILDHIQQESRAKILVALKGYSFWREFEDLKHILHGATCSGLYEARLAYEEIANDFINTDNKKEVCVFSPAFKESSFKEILNYATHIIFNSFNQWERFKDLIYEKNKTLENKIEVGLRINPLYSEVTPEIYNPCAPKSRLGITPHEFERNIAKFSHLYKDDFFATHFNGLHFHTHCEQNSNALQKTLQYVEKYFSPYIKQSKWMNFGGGHHITKNDYDKNLLIKIIKDFKATFSDIDVFLEPGEAIGWEVGDLFSSVVDIVENNGKIAILDISATNHMPDCLEMPYRPKCCAINAKNFTLQNDLGENIKNAHNYRLAGTSCLAGDIVGDYSFKDELNIGDFVVFKDMIHYTIVKNNTFNGIELPSLGVIKNKKYKVLKTFHYLDFKERN